MNEDITSRPAIAVALQYDGESSPRVIAKGLGEAAERILQTAQKHDIPLQENAELSRILGELDLGEHIPVELYQAVAEVLAFAFSLSGKQPGAK